MKIRNNKTIIAALSMVVALGFTGCSVFKPSSNQESSGKGLQGWVESEKEEASKAAKTAKEELKKGEKAAKADAEKAMTKAEDKMKQLDGDEINAAPSGDWAIESVLGKKAIGETAPFIKFVPGEGRIYGNNGCNIINGSYTADSSAKRITFRQLATTMMLCADNNITDAEIGEALGLTTSYSMKPGNDEETIMCFFDAGGKQVMELMHRDFHFLDGSWAVTAIDREKVNIEGMKIA